MLTYFWFFQQKPQSRKSHYVSYPIQLTKIKYKKLLLYMLILNYYPNLYEQLLWIITEGLPKKLDEQTIQMPEKI